ncbi:MAG: SpoIID/LytB domain-containing protein, partial [Myxococcales bacterium]|nr:SpoIID/LytB domain-containing protein [Myxococcales bacterium]
LFHSTCGGTTLASEDVFGHAVPYLRERDCRWCRDSRRFRWTARFDERELSEVLTKAGLSRGFRRIERDSESARLRLIDHDGGRDLRPESLRAALGTTRLFSATFSVAPDGDGFLFTGRGFGHRVGMCQWGARGMALEGRDYREIILHYFRGAELARAY